MGIASHANQYFKITISLVILTRTSPKTAGQRGRTSISCHEWLERSLLNLEGDSPDKIRLRSEEKNSPRGGTNWSLTTVVGGLQARACLCPSVV
jgi:hypothetical protein